MPKMKTQRGAMKRFKLTSSNKVKRKKAYTSHILTKKSSKRKRSLNQPAYVSKSDLGRVKRMLLI
jgi:large subunit ribosomal protein L35